MIPREIVGLAFTQTEREIMHVLGDGEAHSQEDLAAYDKHVEKVTITTHVFHMRKKLNVSRYRIYSGTENGKLVYRLTMLLPMAASLK